jgi:hypothetical protein
MTWDDVTTYMVPAVKALYVSTTAADAMRLEALLHRDEYHAINSYSEGVAVNKEIDPDYKAELLAIGAAGPHAKTVLKIILIRKGLPHEDV